MVTIPGLADDPVRRRTSAAPTQRFPDTGFRCARPVGGKLPRALPLGVTPPAAPQKPAERGERGRVVLRVAGWPGYVSEAAAGRFAKQYQARTGVAVVVTQTTVVANNDAFARLLEERAVELVTPSCDVTKALIGAELVQPFVPGREAELAAAYRRPPFLQSNGRGYGACAAGGHHWLLALDPAQAVGGWKVLWTAAPVALRDDAVWAITLAAEDLGLSPVHDLSDQQLADVRERLRALLERGARLWGTPAEAERARAAGVVAIDDRGVLQRTWSLRRPPRHSKRVARSAWRWVDAWMIGVHVRGRELAAARAWIEFALSPREQCALFQRVGYEPVNPRALTLLDKASALAQVGARAAADAPRLPAVPRRARYVETWAAVKQAVGR